MNQLQEVKEMIKEIIGHEYLYLDSAIQIKANPHSYPYTIWALCVCPRNELYIMDSNNDWHKIEEKDTLIIPSVYQRIKLVSTQYAPQTN
jgi:hypothetical protein